MPRPPVKQTDPPLTNEEARERVGDFVRRALLVHRRLAATGWPTEVGWDDVEIWATARRGELVLRTWERNIRWWSPAIRRHALDLADSFARVLLKIMEQYGEVDESGRAHATVWRDARDFYHLEEVPGAVPRRYVLEVGWRILNPNQGPGPILTDLRNAGGIHIREALARGIIRPEDSA